MGQAHLKPLGSSLSTVVELVDDLSSISKVIQGAYICVNVLTAEVESGEFAVANSKFLRCCVVL